MLQASCLQLVREALKATWREEIVKPWKHSAGTQCHRRPRRDHRPLHHHRRRHRGIHHHCPYTYAVTVAFSPPFNQQHLINMLESIATLTWQLP